MSGPRRRLQARPIRPGSGRPDARATLPDQAASPGGRPDEAPGPGPAGDAGHDHHLHGGLEAPPRDGGSAPIPFAGLRRHARALGGGLLLLVLLLLLPDLGPVPTSDSPAVLVRGRLVQLLPPSTEPGTPDARVLLLDGSRAGETVEAFLQGPNGTQEVPRYAAGDEVIVTVSTDPSDPSGSFIAVTDRWRLPAIALAVGLFVAAVAAVGGWRGVRSIVALALTLAAVVKLVVPLILSGWSPVPVAVLVATAVTVATVVLTEGVSRASVAAVVGTFASLTLVGGLAVLFADLAAFTELQGAEDIVFLDSLGLGDLDLGGILLAAVILGALGVLDDVTITQAATVEALRASDPAAPLATLFGRAMRVGRAHIAATVNTLVLAYVGASLPLILLFAAGRQAPGLIASGEAVAVEIMRALAGSIGIVAAVPLTTAVAALWPARRPPRA